jgi:ribosomal protein S18 acetylase RimI-like enzyme
MKKDDQTKLLNSVSEVLPNSLKIRKFRTSDAIFVANIIKRCLLEVNIKDYSEKVIKSMCDHFSPQHLIEISAKREVYVIVKFGEILGTGGLTENNVRSVFVDPDLHRSRIGSQLMKHLETQVMKRGYSYIELFSSVTAFEFYRKLGYRKLKVIQDEDMGEMILMRKMLDWKKIS